MTHAVKATAFRLIEEIYSNCLLYTQRSRMSRKNIGNTNCQGRMNQYKLSPPNNDILFCLTIGNLILFHRVLNMIPVGISSRHSFIWRDKQGALSGQNIVLWW